MTSPILFEDNLKITSILLRLIENLSSTGSVFYTFVGTNIDRTVTKRARALQSHEESVKVFNFNKYPSQSN